MKILITAHFRVFPMDSGGAVRTISIASCLEKMGHQIIMLTGDNPLPAHGYHHIPGEWNGFKMYGQPGYFMNPSFYRAYVRLLAKSPDLIISSCPFQSFMLVQQAKKKKIPIVYDSHNVEADRFRSSGNHFKSLIVRKAECYLARHARAILAVSVEDRKLFKQYYDVEALLLPNGVDVKKFSPDGYNAELISTYELNDKRVLIYFGSYDYPPNIEALRYLLKIWPDILNQYPDARLLVVGRYPPDWAGSIPGVIVTGPVDDIAAHIRLANIVVVPLKQGGGTRLKILEALACGQTVLSTPFGATGIEPDQDQKALILSDLNDFQNKLFELLHSPPDPCSNMISKDLALKYDWCSMVANIDWERLLL
ncbi:MAG: glycosyltransferase [Desulfobacteraceae bacterium]|nr:MAG: glycosyltransferase [Desulfobacteraceae bacterium]